MSQKTYCLAAGVIFAAIAVLHLLRLGFGWEAAIAGAEVPHWVSLIALLIAGFFAYQGFRLSK